MSASISVTTNRSALEQTFYDHGVSVEDPLEQIRPLTKRERYIRTLLTAGMSISSVGICVGGITTLIGILSSNLPVLLAGLGVTGISGVSFMICLLLYK